MPAWFCNVAPDMVASVSTCSECCIVATCNAACRSCASDVLCEMCFGGCLCHWCLWLRQPPCMLCFRQHHVDVCGFGVCGCRDCQITPLGERLWHIHCASLPPPCCSLPAARTKLVCVLSNTPHWLKSVFKLPSKKPTDKDKPRQIDRMLEQLKK